MRDRDQRHVPFEFVPERCLYDRIRLVICVRHALRQHRPQKDERRAITNSRGSWKRKKFSQSRKVRGKCAPSSRMSSLLPRTIARASAKICRCPTERLLPPLEIWLSSVRRSSSSSLCNEKSPEARRALFSAASSYWENGSRFSRSEPLSNSGCVKQKSLVG